MKKKVCFYPTFMVRSTFCKIPLNYIVHYQEKNTLARNVFKLSLPFDIRHCFPLSPLCILNVWKPKYFVLTPTL